MKDPSRRTCIAYGGIAVIGSLAGCLDNLFDEGLSPPGDSSTYDDWLPSAFVSPDEFVTMQYLDTAVIMENWPEELLANLPFDQIAAQFGIETTDIHGFFTLYLGAEMPVEEHSIYLGEFDTAAVVDALASNGADGDHAGYLRVDAGTYVGADAIITSNQAELLIDTRIGDGTKAVDANDHVATAVDDGGGTELVTLYADPDEPHELIAVTMQLTGDEFAITSRAFFADAEDAAEHEESVSDDMIEEVGVGEVDTITVEGNVLTVEITSDLEEHL